MNGKAIAILAVTLIAAAPVTARLASAQSGEDERTEDTSGAPKAKVRQSKELPVDWEAVRRDQASPLRTLSDDPGQRTVLQSLRERMGPRLEGTRVPVLVPRNPELLEKFKIFSKEDFYTASARHDGHVVQITGTRVAQTELTEGKPKERLSSMRARRGFITQRTAYGIECAFSRYGASYSISVQCEDPNNDPRCTEEDYIEGLARSVVFVGGRGGTEGDEE